METFPVHENSDRRTIATAQTGNTQPIDCGRNTSQHYCIIYISIRTVWLAGFATENCQCPLHRPFIIQMCVCMIKFIDLLSPKKWLCTIFAIFSPLVQ